MTKLLQHIIIGLLIFLLLINFSCKKEEDSPEVTNKIEIGITNIDTISYYSSTISTILTSTGGHQITQHGHCWSIDKEPTIEDNHTKLGSKNDAGTFISELDSLEPTTEYYVRAYTAYALGTVYGEIKEFKTINTGKPVVTTSEVQNITLSAAECGGVVVNDSGLVVTARGVCWNTTDSPTLDDCISFTSDSIGTGNFTSQVTNLQEGTTYFICSYATNSKGTSYGEKKLFITIPIEIPEVVTGVIMNITANTAECGGSVTSAGNGTVTARGVCWSTSINPTINDPYTINGSGTGSFVSQLTGLTPNTTYYVRAYVTNEAGTAYGNQLNFTTLTDVLPSVTTTEVSNITQNFATSGGNVTSSGGGTVSARGVCWSTSVNPTIGDPHTTNGSGTGSFVSQLTSLTPNTTYYVRAYATNEGGTAYGNQVSFETLTDLLPSVTTVTVSNITQNSATSGGNVTNNGCGTVSARGICWSTSINPTIGDLHTTNGSGTGSFVSQLSSLTPSTTYYVRAYVTNEAGTAYGNQVSFETLTDLLPSVTTVTVSNITQNSATSGGNVTSNGGGTVSARGVCWSISENPTLDDPFTTNGSGTGSFVSELTGLTPTTIYYVRAYTTNEVGTAYGNEIEFTTDFENCGEVSYEGETYPTLIIGSQCWFRKNLNVGSMINGTENQQNNSVIEKYCYNDQESNCDEYGGLYQWNEMMQYVTTEGAQGICPEGWHIPSDNDWDDLVDFLGGSNVAGGKMKETGYDHWNSPNSLATNSSGFTAFPGGYRTYSGGSFYTLGNDGLFWSSSLEYASSVWYRSLYYRNEDVYRGHYYKTYGLSVRCLQD